MQGSVSGLSDSEAKTGFDSSQVPPVSGWPCSDLPASLMAQGPFLLQSRPGKLFSVMDHGSQGGEPVIFCLCPSLCLHQGLCALPTADASLWGGFLIPPTISVL